MQGCVSIHVVGMLEGRNRLSAFRDDCVDGTCMGRHAGVALLVVPVFVRCDNCVDAAARITARSAVIALGIGCSHSAYCVGGSLIGAVASSVSLFGVAVGEMGVEICESGEGDHLLLLRLLVGLNGTNVSLDLFGQAF